MEPHYVNYELDIWEMGQYFDMIDLKTKKELIEKRFWTYLNMAPHIDTKKCKGPESLIKFEWEQEQKNKAITKGAGDTSIIGKKIM